MECLVQVALCKEPVTTASKCNCIILAVPPCFNSAFKLFFDWVEFLQVVPNCLATIAAFEFLYSIVLRGLLHADWAKVFFPIVLRVESMGFDGIMSFIPVFQKIRCCTTLLSAEIAVPLKFNRATWTFLFRRLVFLSWLIVLNFTGCLFTNPILLCSELPWIWDKCIVCVTQNLLHFFCYFLYYNVSSPKLELILRGVRAVDSNNWQLF